VIDHVTHDWRGQVHAWNTMMARSAVLTRHLDPELPGAKLMSWGPVFALLLTGARYLQTSATMIRVRRAQKIGWAEQVVHLGMLGLLMPAYFAGLCRELRARRSGVSPYGKDEG
jgi:hypothetical protein